MSIQPRITAETTGVFYSPTLLKLRPKLKPEPKPYPEPPEIKEFRQKLEDPEMKEAVTFDEITGRLIFSGPKGLDALERFLNQNPNTQFGLMLSDRSNLKASLLELKNRGLLDRLANLDINGQQIMGDELKREIQKSINWPPRLTPNACTYS